MSAATAELIAGDLAIAIHRGVLRPGEQVPSQTKLMVSYGVAMATANSALLKLRLAGLCHAVPGKGTFVTDTRPGTGARPNPILDVFTAARVCRSLAATYSPPPDGAPMTIPVGGHHLYGTEHEDPEKHWPPRPVDCSALTGLDRHVLRWMSEAFLVGGRRLVGRGRTETDQHLIEAAQAIINRGGNRPENQLPIAELKFPEPEDEDVILRIWPERTAPVDPEVDPEWAPF